MGTGVVILLIVAAVVALVVVALASQRRQRAAQRALVAKRPPATAATRVCTRPAPSGSRRAPRSRPRGRAGRPPRPRSGRSARRWSASAPRTSTSGRVTSIPTSTTSRRRKPSRHNGTRDAHAHLTGTTASSSAGQSVTVADERHEPHRLQIRALERVAAAALQQQALLAAVDRGDQAAPSASCSSSAAGTSWAAAATLIASNGACSGSPRDPSPTTTCTFSMPAAARLRCACSASFGLALDAPHLAREVGQDRRVIARAGADVEHLLVAASARAPRTCARPPPAARWSVPRRSAARCSPTRTGRGPRGRTDAGGRPRPPPAPVRPRCTAGSSLRGSRPRRVTWPWPLSLGPCARRLRHAGAAYCSTIIAMRGRAQWRRAWPVDRDRPRAVCAPAAAAHPLGNFSVNHQTRVKISRDRIDLLYILDQAEIPTFQERRLSGRETLRRKTAGGAREPAADRERQAGEPAHRHRVASPSRAARAACRRRASSCRSCYRGTCAAGRGARPHVPRARRVDRHRRRARARHRGAHVGVLRRSHQQAAHVPRDHPAGRDRPARRVASRSAPGSGTLAGPRVAERAVAAARRRRRAMPRTARARMAWPACSRTRAPARACSS